MVCSCAMPSNSVWLQIIFCLCVKETELFSFLRSLFRENGRSLRFPTIFLKKQTRWSNDKKIIELGYRKISWFVSVSQMAIIFLGLRLRQILDLLAKDKSQYFAKPCPVSVNYGCIMRIIKSRFLWWERYKVTCDHSVACSKSHYFLFRDRRGGVWKLKLRVIFLSQRH